MRTGAEYRAALHDGRRVWVLGEGLIEDVTTHPATRAMVDEYVAWYDLHFAPGWTDILFSPRDAEGGQRPWAYMVPRTSDDLRGMGRSFAKTTFLNAGNITHTPAYGNLIALGVITAVQEYNAPAEQIANTVKYRDDRAGGQVEPRAGRLGELLPSRLSHQSVSGARQLHSRAVPPVVALQVQGQATQGRDLSTLAPLRALRSRTPDRAWLQRAVGEGVRSCPRAGCGKSACPVR